MQAVLSDPRQNGLPGILRSLLSAIKQSGQKKSGILNFLSSSGILEGLQNAALNANRTKGLHIGANLPV